VPHIGLSNVTRTQIEEGWRICDIVFVQNMYNIARRENDALIDDLARDGIAYAPFPQATELTEVANSLGASPMQVALAWLLRAPNILLIPGTSSAGHLRENLAVANLELQPEAAAALDQIATGMGPRPDTGIAQ
jgi:pyridoxine 4-dehydrogenase